MSEKRFRTNDLVKFNYSEIKEYVDEKHTPTPLRNDEVCKLLNEQQATITELKETIKSVEKQLEDNYHLEIEDGYVVPSMKDIAKDYFDPESEIMVTNGGMGAFALIMQCVLSIGDEVLIQDPQYLNFKQTINLCGGVAVPVPTTFESGFCMSAEEIRAKYVKGKTKMLIINSPNNPTGEVIPRDKLAEIAKVAVELDLLVVSDEVYGSLLYDNQEPLSISTFPGMKERTIVVGSFSKRYAMTGWRIGYLAGPRGIVDKMIKVQEYFNSCINTPAQYGATFALNHPEFAEEVRLSFEKRREIVLQGFKNIKGIEPNNPKGAFYLFPDIKSFGMDSITFCNKLLDEAKVVCTPGSAFGECGEGYMRVSYTAEKDKLLEALERINTFCNRLG